jgi:hypothetical protein
LGVLGLTGGLTVDGFGTVVVGVLAPPVFVAGFTGAFTAGLAATAGFLGVVVVVWLTRLAAPSNPARISAAEPYLMALRISCMVIVSSILFQIFCFRFLFQARAPSRMRERFTQRR